MADRGKVVDAELNKVRRSNFSPEDICQIILQIDGMELMAEKESEHFNYFALELLNPLKGINMGKKYRLIFTIAKIKNETIGTITLYRVK